MAFFAIIRDNEAAFDVLQCHINMWCLGGIFGLGSSLWRRRKWMSHTDAVELDCRRCDGHTNGTQNSNACPYRDYICNVCAVQQDGDIMFWRRSKSSPALVRRCRKDRSNWRKLGMLEPYALPTCVIAGRELRVLCLPAHVAGLPGTQLAPSPTGRPYLPRPPVFC